MYYMIDISYMIDILYMSYQQGMSYLSDMYYQDDMLLYVYVYDTILSLYISIFMFHVKHLYVVPYNCLYNCISFWIWFFLSNISIIVFIYYVVFADFYPFLLLKSCDNLAKIFMFLGYFLCYICYNCVLYSSL